MPLGLFIFLAALAVISALGVDDAAQSGALPAGAGAVLLIDCASLFMGLDAVTVGFLQIIVYVGAIMVLFLFVIWLLNMQAESRSARDIWRSKLFGGCSARPRWRPSCSRFVSARAEAARRADGTAADFGSIASARPIALFQTTWSPSKSPRSCCWRRSSARSRWRAVRAPSCRPAEPRAARLRQAEPSISAEGT